MKWVLTIGYANTDVITQINVFTVPEGGQQALIDLLKEAAQFATHPFSAYRVEISARIRVAACQSRDGTRVVTATPQSENLPSLKRMPRCESTVKRLKEGGWLDTLRGRFRAGGKRRIRGCTTADFIYAGTIR